MKRKSKSNQSCEREQMKAPKWGTPEHAKLEAEFFAKHGATLPGLPIISDDEFYRLQDLAAKYR